MCHTHFTFPGNLGLEAFDSEALGLQASFMVYHYLSQIVFMLKRSHLAKITIQIPYVGIVVLSFELIGHLS